MKKIAVLGALALSVGVMVVVAFMFAASFGGATPASAVPLGKTEICHWDTGFTKSNPDSASFRAPSWVVINVNGNAVDSHLGVTHDGAPGADHLPPGECA